MVSDYQRACSALQRPQSPDPHGSEFSPPKCLGKYEFDFGSPTLLAAHGPQFHIIPRGGLICMTEIVSAALEALLYALFHPESVIWHICTTLEKAKMSTNTQPELKFFLYSDPAEAKSPDNKRLVRVHVARNSHAKTRNARTRTSNQHQAHGEEDYLQGHSNELDAQVVSRTPSPSIPSGSQSSPDPLGVFEPATSLPSPLVQLPSGGPAQRLVQGLSPDDRFLLDHCE